jgi:hypothetical protein
MSGFKFFAADAAFKNQAPRDFFTHPTKNKCPIIARFLPESLIVCINGPG